MSYSSGGLSASSVAIGDVNRDGKLDLIVTICTDSACDGALSVLQGEWRRNVSSSGVV